MDVSIDLNHPDIVFTNGDTIFGRVAIYCPNTTIIVSRISASLLSETTSIVTDTTGIMMNRKGQEKHNIVHETQTLLPRWERDENIRAESLKLGFGHHHFDFALKLPWFPQCLTCPPSSAVFNDGIRDFGPSELPPSMKDLVRGANVSYRIEVAVTIYRNLFKSTTRKASPHPSDNMELLSTVVTSMRAQITASFLPQYHLSSGSKRNVAMRLSVKKMHEGSYTLYLTSFQLLLFGYTDIRAGSVSTGQMSCWTLQSLSNLGLELIPEGDTQECDIGSALWHDKCIPEEAVPTFDACNLARRYEVEILVGLQCWGKENERGGRVSVVQLRVPVQIGSGIAPGRKMSDVKEGVPVAANICNIGALEQKPSTSALGDENEIPAPPTYDEAVNGMVRSGLA
ncbi:hypothetical protein BKA66DRAFT_598310 [Pyrenochaeta sp. MPI-SDFR-AT-0127]|nr:hypothetical protein BKA66DRAFT_598310 [Pyrenochaeta sp. MPI-SDFR-AT-0127]